MITKTVRVYVAKDNREFISEELCKDHEEMIELGNIIAGDKTNGRELSFLRGKVAYTIWNNFEAIHKVITRRRARLARIKAPKKIDVIPA